MLPGKELFIFQPIHCFLSYEAPVQKYHKLYQSLCNNKDWLGEKKKKKAFDAHLWPIEQIIDTKTL